MPAFGILLVEDNPADARLVERAVSGLGDRCVLHQAADGVEAMDFLRREGGPIPALVLLDIRLPRKGGHEVLSEIRADPRLSLIPVIMMSSSDAEEDVLLSYRSGANCYLMKPVTPKGFQEALSVLLEFWLTHARLPPR